MKDNIIYIIGWIGHTNQLSFLAKSNIAIDYASYRPSKHIGICDIYHRASQLVSYRSKERLKQNNPPGRELGYTIYKARENADGTVTVLFKDEIVLPTN